MKFDEIYIPHKEEVRKWILEVFGRDPEGADCYFSSRNYALIFTAGCFPAVVRLNVDGAKTREDVMSELMWVDDLRLSIPTIAQCEPSKNNWLAEELDLGENHYCATMFRKANGDKTNPAQWDEVFFREAGRLLGKIHAASHEAKETGFRYKRRRWDELPLWDFENYPHLSDSAKKRARELFEMVKELPEEPDSFGMIHGDYQYTNLFRDWNDIWVFDFDDCCYGHYLYDIATFLHLTMSEVRYRPGEDRKEAVWGEKGAIKYFREGYETAYRLSETQWGHLDLFVRLRIAAGMGIVSRNKARTEESIRFILNSQEEYLADGDLKENVSRLMRERMKTMDSKAMEQLMSIKNRMSAADRQKNNRTGGKEEGNEIKDL